MDAFTEAINEVQNDDFVGCDSQDNTIEFLRNAKRAVVTFSQGKYITKIRKYAKERPDECQITAENKDGSIVAIIPTKWVKISPPRFVSDEQRKASGERLKQLRRNAVSVASE